MSNWYHLYNFFDNPHQSGFLIFILGILFILSLYHFLLYFQHKDKSYLWYSIYTFLIFFSHMYWMESAYTKNLIAPIKPFIDSIYLNLVWGYNMLYFVFAFTFVNLKSYSPKWYKIIFYYLAALCFIMLLIDIAYRVSGDIEILRNGDIFFLIAISVIAILGYIPLFKAPVSVKYYIIIGSFVLFATSVLATSMYHFEFGGYSDLRFSIFYTGVIIENLLFSLGLGHRQKIIMDERNRAQEKLIRQLLENENLKMEVENKLHQELELLQSKLEVDKLENLNMQFQKDLAEQKLEALRSHMNPHFIFNSLNSIKRFIIENDQKKAVFYLNKFSKLIRKILS
ncbi:MAG TPA: 7TM diverse intracellular signaling domain-containing protein, partial [Flavobacteriaceae bacterium]|nr:7TM diverse intracellular signaling domain-containing protein [Flavobacteriaceae bacterium]